MAVFGGIPSIFKGYHFLLNHFFFGGGNSESKNVDFTFMGFKKTATKVC